jgi:hypothetical protein
LDMTKPIDCQDTKKIKKGERHLGKKIQYINLGLNHEHLRLIVGIFLN